MEKGLFLIECTVKGIKVQITVNLFRLVTVEMLDKIPGKLTDRRTPLGSFTKQSAEEHY